MARLVDHTKLESVKKSAMQLIVKKGYGGASISSIAKKAKVAEGYLYRFFKSKEELVISLLNSKLEQIADNVEESLNNSSSVEEIVTLIIQNIFTLAKKSKTDIKFMYVMMNDYNFSVHTDLRKRIMALLIEANKRGHEQNHLDKNIGIDELFLFTVIYPIQFINLRLKNFFGENEWTEEDIENLISICNKTLKK